MAPNALRQFAGASRECCERKPRPQNTLTGIASPLLQKIVRAGLLREKFVREAQPAFLRELESFAYRCMFGQQTLKGSIGTYLLEQKIITAELIENVILADHTNSRKEASRAWAQFLKCSASELFKELVAEGRLGTAAIINMMKYPEPFYKGSKLASLKSLTAPGTSNAINWGITGIFEYEATQAVIVRGYRPRDAYINEPNPLMRAMRATEHLDLKRAQIEAVVSPDDNRPFTVQLESVWRHYAAKSGLFRTMAEEEPVPDKTRAHNVKLVNELQRESANRKLPQPKERFIDLYARYNLAEMDPLMLAIIARTARWYIDNKHAQLFTGARLLADYRRNLKTGLDSFPWAAQVLCPRMPVLKVDGHAFINSMLGANRIFLTHSQASEASDLHSIPVIGIATWCNPSKLNTDAPYALLAADFDHVDRFRDIRRKWRQKDYAASFSGLINQTLRALREVETLEITRAQGVELILGRRLRWIPRPQTPAAQASNNAKAARYGS